MDHPVIGTVLPALETKLAVGKSVVAESGELSWMTSSIELGTAATGKAGRRCLRRGETCVSRRQLLHDRAHGPIRPGDGRLRHACPRPDPPDRRQRRPRVPDPPLALPVWDAEGRAVDRAPTEARGRALRWRRVHPPARRGSRNAWIELDGEIVDDQLAAGESLRVRPGHVGMFDAAVSFELDRIKGIKNTVFGGDEIFLARLTGPGHVWLQTLPLPKLARALLPYLPQPQSESKGGGSVSSILDNR